MDVSLDVVPHMLYNMSESLGVLTEEFYVGIKYEDLAYGTHNRFASVGSNNGHNGTAAVTMYHNPDVVTDFAWRSCVILVCRPTSLLPFAMDSR